LEKGAAGDAFCKPLISLAQKGYFVLPKWCEAALGEWHVISGRGGFVASKSNDPG
jgi:hypothetical protein